MGRAVASSKFDNWSATGTGAGGTLKNQPHGSVILRVPPNSARTGLRCSRSHATFSHG